jgi:UDP-N-acetylglucosamine 2-epimerase (non-hydrolysing)
LDNYKINMLIDIIAGARPNFMKIAPIIHEINKRNNPALTYRLIHTGQHYDKKMSESFFEQLNIPKPDINLGVGSGTQSEQTAGIMVKYEAILKEKKSDLCLVVGDVTSTMACSIVAKKEGLTVAHVEGGIRSSDITMPEEVNRIVTDAVTDIFYTTSDIANNNLKKLGHTADKIVFVGNTMIDTLLANYSRLIKPAVWDELSLKPQNYFVLTLHRPANVDEEDKLTTFLETIAEGARGLPVIFPIHPRTKKIFEKSAANFENIHLVDPLGYLEFNYLVKHSKAMITDSGGITEETTVMGVPCMTLRDNTERPETITIGTNELVGTNPENLKPYLETLFAGNWKKGQIPRLWDGNTSSRIVDHLLTQI